MRYISTRGQAPPVSFLDAVLAGMAPDGGLYVPESWPDPFASKQSRRSAATAHYTWAAMQTLWAFAGEVWEESPAIVNDAYLRTPPPDDTNWTPLWPETVTPLAHIGPGDWVLELFHGPSLSFKDVAMQFMAPLYDYALKARGERLTIICATSGDTGGAAVEAFKGRERVDLFVLTPKGRVSEVQRRFMATSGADNVFALEVDGDFDACQALVKSLLADADFATRARLSPVNSINWARIAAQSVYYHVASNILCAPGPVHFVVPTGNFGNAYSGFVAARMGAPIGDIVIATNANDILTRVLRTGRYERAAHSLATLSPAMDIQAPSNFERILFEALERDADHVRALYAQFAQSGGFDIPAPALAFLRDYFQTASVDDPETQRALVSDYAICPHTAVGFGARGKIEPPLSAPLVTLATAHPAKFPETVEAATGVRPELPSRCSDLFQRPEKFDSLPCDVEAVKLYIRERSRAWS